MIDYQKSETLSAVAADLPDAEAILRWVSTVFPGRVKFASSLGLEDQVLTDMICRMNLAIPIFTLDTGRLFPETYELIECTEKRYGIRIGIYFPDRRAVERMVAAKGVNLFRASVANRKECCGVRKVVPLNRALRNCDAWVCGLRREQSDTRENLRSLVWDAGNGLLKANPLADWSFVAVKAYAKANDVPYNPLQDKGFVSIGCACCTRAIGPGEDFRAGRWWWEDEERKECGLHWVDGKLVHPASNHTNGDGI